MKKLAITFAAFFIFAATSIAAVMSFTDVSVNDWFYNGVQYVSDNGLMTGYGDGNFGPNDSLTRGQLATVLERMDAAAIEKLKADIEVLKSTNMVGFEGWQTYVSTAGFSFMYPQGYVVSASPDPVNPDITIIFILAAAADGTALEQPPVLQMNVTDYSVSFSLWEGIQWDAYPDIVRTFVRL